MSLDADAGVDYAWPVTPAEERASCRNLLCKKFQPDRQVRFASTLPDASNSKAGDDVENFSPLSPEPWSTDVVVDHGVVEHVTGPSSDGPVGAAMSLIDGLHSTTGLPWWATLSVTALGDDPSLLHPPPAWCQTFTSCLVSAFTSSCIMNFCLSAGIRAALFPLALRQVQASAGLGVLLQQVRLHDPW